MFDASGLPNYRRDGKSDLAHTVSSSIDGAWINLWRDKIDLALIDAMSAIFHLPKSTKFGSLQMLSLLYINHFVKETSAAFTVIIIFDSYYENSLKALTSERRKGDYLRVQYEVIESTDISNVSTNELSSHKKIKKIPRQILERQAINHLKSQGISF